MINKSLFDTLVPDAPLYRRTDADQPVTVGLETRRDSGKLLKQRDLIPGLQTPSLVSSYDGRIDQLLLSFPAWAVERPGDCPTATGRSSQPCVRTPGSWSCTRTGTAETVAGLVHRGRARGGPRGSRRRCRTTCSFTDWAEDGYVALIDAGRRQHLPDGAVGVPAGGRRADRRRGRASSPPDPDPAGAADLPGRQLPDRRRRSGCWARDYFADTVDAADAGSVRRSYSLTRRR